jgi:serine phosphatase RsbU (regulator of sigma subunit)
VVRIDIAVAKTHKYASRESGDTVETAERPTGGMSVVMVDGQGSGAAAKSLSMLVSSKALSLLKEGIRDGAVARATHDFLLAFRHGKVSATLDIVSVDLGTSEIVVTRNNPIPYVIGTGDEYTLCTNVAGPIGVHRHTRPIVDSYPVEPGRCIVVFSDGIAGAGKRGGSLFDPVSYLRQHSRVSTTAQEIADGMLMAAIEADNDRPADDMSVVVLSLVDTDGPPEPIRRMWVSIPVPG